MVGIVDGRAARLILRSGRATHPVPGSRGHWQKEGLDTRTVQRRDRAASGNRTPTYALRDSPVFDGGRRLVSSRAEALPY